MVWETIKIIIRDYGSLIASITALFIAGGGGRWLMTKFYRPKLEIVGFGPHKQASNLKVWRIVIKNYGNEVARNVQADVIKIYDKNKERENFLPIPLQWTHLNQESRDIFPGQTTYLDFFDDIPGTHSSPASVIHSVRLRSQFGLDVADFTYLKNETSEVQIAIFHDRMRPRRVKIYTRIDLMGISSIASTSGILEKL